jgi:hypothetical protein
MIKPKFFGKVSKGYLVYDNNNEVKKHLQNFQDGQEVEIMISKKYKKRTAGLLWEETNFNGYYWGVIVRIIADTMGEFDREGYDRIHCMLQMEVNNVKILKNGRKVPLGTKEMSGAEFADYCSKCRMWANQPDSVTQEGIYIPTPNDVDY